MSSTLQKTATIKDVAARAGVSVGTVSRVLANEEAVKPRLKDQVDLAVKELNYKVNYAARALRTKHIDVIGLLVPDISNPFFAQLAKSVEVEAAKRNHSVMLANSHDDAAIQQTQISALLSRSVRGILVAAAPASEPLDLNDEVPIVSLDRRFLNTPLVSTDHKGGSALVADHLYDLGHRKIAYIAGPQNTEVGRLRKEGFLERIEELNRSHKAVEVSAYQAQFDFLSGEEIAQQIFNLPVDQRPTAIAAANDQLAIGALRSARDFKISVPAELSVAGFDDIMLATLVVPRLTTVRQPIDVLTQRAIQIVFGEEMQEDEVPVLGELMVRGSTSSVRRFS